MDAHLECRATGKWSNLVQAGVGILIGHNITVTLVEVKVQ